MRYIISGDKTGVTYGVYIYDEDKREFLDDAAMIKGGFKSMLEASKYIEALMKNVVDKL